MDLCSTALNCSSVIGVHNSTALIALALSTSMKTKRLLVLDLNGTILHRLTHAFEVKLFRNHPVVLLNKLNPDITVHGSKIILRPHTITFLTHVLKHFDVAVWTSSRPHNALPMVHHSFKNLLDFSSILEEANQRAVTVRQVILGPSDKGAEIIKGRLLEDTIGKAKLKFIWTQSECDTVTTAEVGGSVVCNTTDVHSATVDGSVNNPPSTILSAAVSDNPFFSSLARPAIYKNKNNYIKLKF